MRRFKKKLVHNSQRSRASLHKLPARSGAYLKDVILLRAIFALVGRSAILEFFMGNETAFVGHRHFGAICVLVHRLLKDRSPKFLVNQVFPVGQEVFTRDKRMLMDEIMCIPCIYRRALAWVAGEPEAWL